MSTVYNAGGGGGPGDNWETVLDVDFVAEPDQVIATNGNYSIGGHTWTKINSTSELAPMAVVSGQGVVITPIQASDYRTTFPGLSIPLSSLISDFTLNVRLRVWLYIASANYVANFDAVSVYIENGATTTATSFWYLFYGAKYSFIRPIYDSALLGDAAIAASPSDDILMFDRFHSGGSMYYKGTYAGGWPAVSDLIWVGGRGGGNVAYSDATKYGLPSQQTLMFGASRTGSATAFVAKIGAVRLDYLL